MVIAWSHGVLKQFFLLRRLGMGVSKTGWVVRPIGLGTANSFIRSAPHRVVLLLKVGCIPRSRPRLLPPTPRVIAFLILPTDLIWLFLAFVKLIIDQELRLLAPCITTLGFGASDWVHVLWLLEMLTELILRIRQPLLPTFIDLSWRVPINKLRRLLLEIHDRRFVAICV